MFDPDDKKYDVTVDYSVNANCLYKICDLLLDKIESKLNLSRLVIFQNDGDKVLLSKFAHEFIDVVSEFADFMEKLEAEDKYTSHMLPTISTRFSNIRSVKYWKEYDKLCRIVREEDPTSLQKWIQRHIRNLKDSTARYFEDLNDQTLRHDYWLENDLERISARVIAETYKEINHSINALAKLTGDYDLIKNLSTLCNEALLGHKEELIKMEVIPE